MKLTRTIGICALIVSSSFWAGGVIWGQDSAGSSRVSGLLNDSSAGQSAMQSLIGRPVGLHYAPQVGFSTQLDHGPGYSGNLYTIDSLFPIHLDTGTNLLFLIANGSATEVGDGVANFGVGYRHYVESLHRVFGISLFADMDRGHQFDYERFGVSVESLGKHLDGRLNLYFVNDDSNVVATQITGSGYLANNIVLNRQTVTEHAYSGGEFELGGPLPGVGRYGMNAYTGVYYLETPGARNTYGWKVRGELLLTESVTAGFNFYNDRLFGRNAFATIGVTLPDGKRPRFMRPRRVRERLVGRVVREARIPVDTLVSTSTELAINPADSAAFQVLHVDPNASASGNGAFESPFESMDALVNSSSADIIMVQGRDDGSGTNLSRTGGLTLLNDQRLLGAALSHSVFSTEGTVALPILSANTPVISNSTNFALQSVVTLADNNEVSGFVIDGANLTGTDNGRGIQGAWLVSFNINQNTFRSYTDGVNLTGVTGTGLFDNNTLTGTVGISDN
ncbi:MAG: inverse autotransporter beta domain-containing protein, partial [Planctomycetaceae bacterium]